MTRSMSHAARFVAACVLCLAAVPAARANLVTNGGFESEASTPAIPPPGWTASGTGMAVDKFFPNSGSYDVAFTALSSDPSPGILSQLIATTVGQSYTLSFWLLDQGLVTGNDAFNVGFGAFSTSVSGAVAAGAYTNVTLTIAGSNVTSTSTTLSFQGLLDPTASGGPFNLDDVSLVAVSSAVPEPPAAALFGVGAKAGSLLVAAHRATIMRR